MDEFVEALDKSEAGHLVNGTWRVEPWTSHDVMARFRFDPPFGERTCFIMGLDEMRIWAEAHPGLERAGFYVGGFNPVVDFAVFPLMYGARRLGVPYRPLSRLLLFCLRTFSRPPFGTLLRLEAEGERAGQPHRLVLTVGHDDGYVFTAIPVVAAVRQWLDGSIRRPGVQLQALAVEPARFLQDMQAMGVRVTWEEAAQTEVPALAGAGT